MKSLANYLKVYCAVSYIGSVEIVAAVIEETGSESLCFGWSLTRWGPFSRFGRFEVNNSHKLQMLIKSEYL